MCLDKDIILGYIPSGTTNDFANSLNLSDRMETAAKTIINDWPRPVDIGLFGK